ncbi:MAG: endonuclease [Gammaproteobacteria bacterium]|nr:endonuclease [Gammaproteobacteria bacterium]
MITAGSAANPLATQSEPAATAGHPSRDIRYWWVNHRQVHRQELEGELLWSPKSTHAGVHDESSNNMMKVMPGDVVFSFANAAIRAVGLALGQARETPNPFESRAARKQPGAAQGWQIPVRFAELAHPLDPRDHLAELVPMLPAKRSPIRASGDVNRRIYLALVPRKMAESLRRLLGPEAHDLIEKIAHGANGQLPDDAEEAAIHQRTDIVPAQKVDLIRARHGQGAYRRNLELVEAACRVTGLLDRRHLRARHMKPWCKCNDAEKLDGCNGLLLSPHLDHLFGRGYISFADSGDLLVSRHLNPAVLEKWGLRLPLNAGAFGPQQCRYLDYHRRNVFESHIGGRRKPHEIDIAAVEDTDPQAPPVTVYGE